MEKLPINYQPGQFNAVIIDQKFVVSPEPWPTDPVLGDAEPEDPIRIVKQFTIKLPKEKQKILFRTFRRFTKMPRKLKKAAKHIVQRKIGDFSMKDQDGTLVAKSPMIHYEIEKGYPHTKWARKSLKLINWSIINHLKDLT